MLLLPAGRVLAQVDGEQTQYVYATYFVCSPDGESRADEIINTSYKPHYDAAVEQGDILSWSWMQHFVGGTWRRVLLIVAADTDSIIDASGALGEIISDQTPEAGRAFSAICSSHEDYIWESVPGASSGGAVADRGVAAFTAYMNCDMRHEERADELVRETLGAVYDAHVKDGELTSWGWLKHNLGGEYRRILALGAEDHKAMMRARAAIVDAFANRRVERAVNEMNEICYAHEDYMWDILVQTP
jgi:hypothetical protein